MSERKIKERRGDSTVHLSIGAKLIIIISIIVLISLGSITALVSWLVREDLKLSAEENNFEVNRRAAAETEQTLEKMRLLSLTFARTAALAEHGGTLREEADYFRPLTGVPSLPPKTVRKTLMTNAEKKPIICGINSIFFQKGGFFQYE